MKPTWSLLILIVLAVDRERPAAQHAIQAGSPAHLSDELQSNGDLVATIQNNRAVSIGLLIDWETEQFGDYRIGGRGGLIMMCAPAVPPSISQGAPTLAVVESPVDSAVAKGT